MDPRHGEAGAPALRLECASDVLLFRSVEDAVAAATEEGDVVALVAAGGSGGALVHWGRAALSRPGVTLTTLGFDLSDESGEGDAGGAASAPPSAGPRSAGTERATLSHETPRPYESTVSVSAPRCRVVGLTIRHSSPSVANNYALHVEEAAASSASSGDSTICSLPTAKVVEASGIFLVRPAAAHWR